MLGAAASADPQAIAAFNSHETLTGRGLRVEFLELSSLLQVSWWSPRDLLVVMVVLVEVVVVVVMVVVVFFHCSEVYDGII